MELTPAQKAAGLLLLVDPNVRSAIIESFNEVERVRVEKALLWIHELSPDELRQVVVKVCEDPMLKVPIAERELDEWFTAHQKKEKRSLLDSATVTRFLRKLDPRTLFYRPPDE